MTDSYLDYDLIAPTYDRRYAVNDMNSTLLGLQELVRLLHAQSVLEVGCGTGHWLTSLSSTVARRYGLDLSAGMLARAQQRGIDLMLVRGSAGSFPFLPDSLDMIFSVNAFHHFPNKQAYISEAFRLLRSGGAVAIIGSDPPTQLDDWYIYNYFPGTYERDVERFPRRQTILDWMAQAGFESTQSRTIEHFAGEYSGRSVLDDPFLAKESTSQLALLSDQEYALGIQRIERAIDFAESVGEPIYFPSNIYLHMLIGWKK